MFSWWIIGLPLTLISGDPASAAAGAEKCTLGKEAIHGALDTRAKNVKEAGPPRWEERGLVESVTWKDDVKVTYQVGGCAHHGYSFQYNGGSIAADADPHARIRRALALLEKTAVLRESKSSKQILVDALRKKSKEPKIEVADTLDLPCGDATCELSTEPLSGGKQRLVIRYDFPL